MFVPCLCVYVCVCMYNEFVNVLGCYRSLEFRFRDVCSIYYVLVRFAMYILYVYRVVVLVYLSLQPGKSGLY